MPYASDQRRFLLRTALFFAPLVAACALIEASYWRIGENWPLSRVAAVQAREPAAIFLRRRFPEQMLTYKRLSMEQRNPTIVVLGSSRTMKFRGELFGDEAARFYNFGSASALKQTQWILDHLPQNEPMRLLYGIDPWWFNSVFTKNVFDRTSELDDAVWSWQAHLTAIRQSVFADYRYLPTWLWNPDRDRLGVTAQKYHYGFRSDGSLRGGLPVPTTEAGWNFVDREVPWMVERIREGKIQYVLTDAPDPRLYDQLRGQLRRLREQRTFVVGFFPPFSAEVIEAISNNPRQAAYDDAVRAAVPKIFAEEGFPFFDISSTAALNLDDRYLIDGMHPEETFVGHMVLRMLTDPRVAAVFPQAEKVIRRALADPATNRWYLAFPGAR